METEGMGYGRKEDEVCRTEFIDMSPLSTDSGSHVAALRVREGSYSWFSCLAETGTKRWPITGELEMAYLPWSEAQGYRMSEWICCVRYARPPGRVRKTLSPRLRGVRPWRAPAPPQTASSEGSVLCCPDLTVGAAVTQLGNLSEWGPWIPGCRG